MKTVQKLALCVGLLAVLSLPLAGCSGTWNGMKEDWHGVTGSSDDSDSSASTTTTTTTTSTAPAPAQQPAAAPAAQDANTMHPDSSTYNR